MKFLKVAREKKCKKLKLKIKQNFIQVLNKDLFTSYNSVQFDYFLTNDDFKNGFLVVVVVGGGVGADF